MAHSNPEEERELAHRIMHELGAHAVVLITVYPHEGTRISTIVSHEVNPRAYPSLVEAIRSALQQAARHVASFLSGTRGTQPVEIVRDDDDDTAKINTIPKKPNKLVH